MDEIMFSQVLRYLKDYFAMLSVIRTRGECLIASNA